MKVNNKQLRGLKTDAIFILDEETKFLSRKLDKKKYHIIASSVDLSSLLSNKFQVDNIVILVELDWGIAASKFYGYEIAKKLMNSPNRLSKFNLLFISTFSRETLYKINSSNTRVFTKSFQHRNIDSSFSLEKLQVAPISDRKFDYLRRYCLTETGILEKLEHDLRPGKSLSLSQIDDLILQIKANADLVGLKAMNILNETNANNFQSKRVHLYEQLANRIKEIAKDKSINATGNREDIWKPLMLLIEDDENQRASIENTFRPYFTVVSVVNGLEARKYIQEHSEQVSVAICDMELLDKYYLDGDIQGIDMIEYIKEHHPHIVIKAASHLPRTGLKMMLGKMLDISDLLYKSMLLDANADFIAELAKEIQNEIDLKRTIQNLRGPSNTLWGNIPRQKNGTAGKLKQFYYEFRDSHPKEFAQMWEEIDIIIQGVLTNKEKINSKFPTVDERNEIAKMPFQKSMRHLKDLLVNRMFWIKILYKDLQNEKVKFDDYKKYFDNSFLLFSPDSNRFRQYASLTGFSIKQDSNGGHILTFNQFLKEELERRPKNSSGKFDYINSFLLDEVQDVLIIIAEAGAQAQFTKTEYPTYQKFCDEDNKLPLIKKTLEQLGNEKSSNDLRSHLPESRAKIYSLLSGLKNRYEYATYPVEIKILINKASENMNKN